SNENDKNKYYGSSSNEESTEESRNINDSEDEELAKEKKASKKKNLIRIKNLKTCILNLGGRHTYEILYDNMPGVFPSSTRIQESWRNIIHHVFQLFDIMKENNYPKKVLVSDATEIILKENTPSTVQFHPRGSLPVRETGLPDAAGSVVYSAIDIIQYFKLYPAAPVQFVIMAQPIGDSAPPVRIGTFASNNKMIMITSINLPAFANDCRTSKHLAP
ncbi:hypothetical protein DAPPUDRAFT_116010, partial [Daphnia pulex]